MKNNNLEEVVIDEFVNSGYIKVVGDTTNITQLLDNPLDTGNHMLIPVSYMDAFVVEQIDYLSLPICWYCFVDINNNVIQKNLPIPSNSLIKSESPYHPILTTPLNAVKLLINSGYNTKINIFSNGESLALNNLFREFSYELKPIRVISKSVIDNLGNVISANNYCKVYIYDVFEISALLLEINSAYINEDPNVTLVAPYAFFDNLELTSPLEVALSRDTYPVSIRDIIPVPKNARYMGVTCEVAPKIAIKRYTYEKTAIYCSSSSSSLEETGSIDHPFKSIEKALNMDDRAVDIYLKRGDVFNLKGALDLAKKTVNILAYGDGLKPVISNFGIISNQNIFKQYDLLTNVWVCNLDTVIYENDHFGNEIAFIYNRSQDEIIWGHRVNCMTKRDVEILYPNGTNNVQGNSYLKENGDFFQKNNELYVYSEKNPNTFGSLEFSFKGICISNIRNSKIQDVKIEGFGIHAISGVCFNARIENLEIDLIGGAVQVADGYDNIDFVRYGNGIELWVSSGEISHDVYVCNCRISRTFDCGATLQGYVNPQKNPDTPRNIHFVNNVIFNCRQSFECFIYQVNESNNIIESMYPVENCSFANNICMMSGENGFKSPEERDAQLYSGTTGMCIKNNIFVDGNYWYYYSTQKFNFIQKNTAYIKQGQYLLKNRNIEILYPIEKDKNTWIDDSNDFIDAVRNAIKKYRSMSNDMSTTFIEIES